MKSLLTEWKKFLNESGFNRIRNILQGKVASVSTVGFMTGENPMAQKLSSKEKAEQLRSELAEHYKSSVFDKAITMGQLVHAHIEFLLDLN